MPQFTLAILDQVHPLLANIVQLKVHQLLAKIVQLKVDTLLANIV
jgi:hypothetical protein